MSSLPAGAARSLAVLALLFCLAPAASAADAPASTELSLTLEPDAVTIGKTASARLVVKGASDPAHVLLYASRGKLGAPAAAAGHAAAATYTPPKEPYPQIEILAARDPASGAVGFLAVPLFGEDTLPVSTEPGATLELHIGAAVYGPDVADKKGRASFPIHVGPGARAELVVTDLLGNRSTKEVDLRIPPTPRLLVLPRAEAFVAGGAPPLCADLFVTDALGHPDATAAVAVRVGGGAPVEAVAPPGAAPGRRVACLRAGASVGSGTTVLRAAVAGGPPGGTWERSMPLLAGAAARVEVRAVPAVVVADGTSAARLEVSVLDAGGNPIAGLVPAVTVDAGTADAVAAPAGTSGRYVAAYHAPAAAPGASRAVVRVRVPVPTGEIVGTGVVRLAAGPPVTLVRLSGADPSGGTGAVRFAVLDAAGARVPLGTPAVTTSAGRVEAVEELDGLVYRARLAGLPHGAEVSGTLAVADAATGFRGELPFIARPAVRVELGAAGAGAWWVGLGAGGGATAWATLRPGAGPLRWAGLLLGVEVLALGGGGTAGDGTPVRARATEGRAELGLEVVVRPGAGALGILAAVTGGAALVDAGARVEGQPLFGALRVVPALRVSAGVRWSLGPGALHAGADLVLLAGAPAAGAGAPALGPQILPGLTLGYVLHLM